MERAFEHDLEQARPPRKGRWRAAVASVVVAGAAFSGGRLTARPAPVADPLVPATTASSVDTSDDSLAAVIETASESIVSVETVSYGGPFGGQTSGEGSGVVIGHAGTVLTNAHVVEGASSISVIAPDGDRLDATLIGSDAAHDVALLRVDSRDLTPIAVGSSEGLRLGDTVVALGYPLGLGATATQGIVSGLDRTIQVADGAFETNELRGLLQTDAAINPGNSGGALIDSAGNLVGINTAAASASSAENVGFAVAIDEVLPIVEDLYDPV